MSKKLNILIVEDFKHDYIVINRILRKSNINCSVCWVQNAKDVISILQSKEIDIILIDYMLPGNNGLELFRQIKQNEINTPVIFITGSGNESVAVEAIKLGAQDYIVKDPLGNYLEIIPIVIKKALSQWKSEQESNKVLEELKKSEERYRAFLYSSSEGIWCFETKPVPINIDEDEIIKLVYDSATMVECNEVMARMYGYKTREDLIGSPLTDLLVPSDERNIEYLRSFIRNGFKLIDGESYEPDIDGKIHVYLNNLTGIIENGCLIRGWGSQRDITEKRKMEEELLKATKLESIGILAGGIAHDFNNILTGIIGNISIAKMYVSTQDKIYDVLTKMEGASFQAKNLTHQLLTFAKGGAPVKKVSSIKVLIEDSTIFALRGSNVKPEFSFAKNLWNVEIDEGQISEVINNLIINANQAMPDGGVINVYAENVHVSKDDVLPLGEGKYVKIKIEDKGIGIPEDYLQKIFDPFFTTKQNGSGLGLATTYSIIKKHDGYIDVKSDIGKGTSFYIYLPASEQEVLCVDDHDFESIRRGTGRVLVMDDEELVRNVAGEMLEIIGYEVEFARDGLEALEKYRESKKRGEVFDCVILDLTVPGGMGGRELIKELIKIDSGVKAIVSSGYSNDPIMANYRGYGFSGVVPKPYKIKELSKVLYEVVKNIEE